MSGTYELGLVIEPRQNDDNVAEIVTKYREMIVAQGATITEEENWGKRKLAYPIRKVTEGKYHFYFISSEGAVQWTDIERNLMQNEKILRHLVVRTDLDLKRAATKAARRKPSGSETEEATDAAEASAEATDAAEASAEATEAAAEASTADTSAADTSAADTSAEESSEADTSAEETSAEETKAEDTGADAEEGAKS